MEHIKCIYCLEPAKTGLSTTCHLGDWVHSLDANSFCALADGGSFAIYYYNPKNKAQHFILGPSTSYKDV